MILSTERDSYFLVLKASFQFPQKDKDLIIMRDSSQEKLTKIIPLITNILKDITKKEELSLFSSRQPLTLAVIERTPVMCLSDMTHSIQAIKLKNKPENSDPVHPNSRTSNNYYCIVDRSWIALNSKVQDIKEPTEYPNPYEPYFHFRRDYEEYKKEKATMSFKVDCEVLLIRSWGLKIVNISGTGYYGVVLELGDFRPTGERFVADACNVTSILYEQPLQEKLQQLRLQDIRRLHSVAEDKKVPWSLFYYCRNINLNPNPKKRLNNIISVDKQQKLLKFDQERRNYFVNFGEMEGVNCLQYPINRKDIDYDKIRRINIKDLQLFFNVKEKEEEKKKQCKPGELWSSDQQLSSEEENRVIKVQQESKESDISSSDSEEDLLKNLYVRQFRKMKIV